MRTFFWKKNKKPKKPHWMFKFVTLHACNFRRKQSFTPGNFSKFPTRPMPGNSTLFFLDHLWRSSTPGPGTSTYILFLHSIPLKSLCIQLPCLDFSGLLDSSFRKSQWSLNFQRYCTFIPPILLLMTHHEKMQLKALP